ncbi:hypothetical protein N0B44_15730 [Roseibacterium beibuensis]|uniref:Uncharacterized protein n=1 Tax=[Roseibacterium] beibuensis TaxID=1193142 RepID=A0ABP9LCT9_9RHOB|nr:hypothetical protein [Roseibacterium beibuensis]MCS6624369.1 hypothetical protein [Roseibacterium beibuensis]
MVLGFPSRARPRPVSPAPDPAQADPYLARLAPHLAPVTTREIVSDDMLRRYVQGAPEIQRGDLPPEWQGELATVLQDIAGELLAHRALADVMQAQAARRDRFGGR